MREILLHWIPSCVVLTGAVILVRALFGKRISARLRYALWAVVLARLLIPVQLFTAPAEVSRALTETPAVTAVLQALPEPERTPDFPDPHEAEQETPVQLLPSEPSGEAAPAAKGRIELLPALGWLWLLGSAAFAGAFAISNLSFYRRLRRVRIPLEGTACALPVYTAEGLPSPCLFGVLRPAIYVTPEAAADLTTLSHVLAHETTHCRHADHIWSLLRCAALAIHWWNPLVWEAARLSRRDAELACDEGALKRLGDGERRAYGETLLTLVTAKPRPGDLFSCATTMTGDKRSLQERVSRIARAPKRWLWAAVLAAGLAVLVCACAFAKTEEKKPDGPLTQEELDYYNNEVFNGEGFNILNQFVYLAVEAPKDYRQIDLFQLFYNGTGMPMEVTEAERQAVAAAALGGEDPMVDLIKCPAKEMDEILRQYLGLGLDETDKWGLDQFTYLGDYDAYYHFHGDTNYLSSVTFTAGERKDGKVLLYYEPGEYLFPVLTDPIEQTAATITDGTCCLTLEEQKDGGFRFLSNWRVNPIPTPTNYPAWDPALTIPLDGLEPYEPEAVTVERHRGDYAEGYYTVRFEPDEFSSDGFDVSVYRSTDGNTYAAVLTEDGYDCFLTLPEAEDRGSPVTNIAGTFTDLFGHDGLTISYYGWLDERYYGEFHDYYTFSDGGTPSLLLRAKGEPQAVDLNGDGVKELTASGGDTTQLFFQRNGTLYEAEIEPLVEAAWPEAGYTEYGWWDRETRSLALSAQVDIPGSDFGTATAYRQMFFDGENLLVYKDENGYTDHVANGLEALPAEVLASARVRGQRLFEVLAEEGYGADGSGNFDEENFGPGNVVWDDWRITGISGPWYETAGPLRVEIWRLNCEFHTTTPDRVILAGGSYRGEDGWCMIGYPNSQYLYFQMEENERTFLFAQMMNDCSPGSPAFLADMVQVLQTMGLLTLMDLDGETLLTLLEVQPATFLQVLADITPREEREKALETLGTYLAEGRGAEVYASCVENLNPGSLTLVARDIWEQLQEMVSGS